MAALPDGRVVTGGRDGWVEVWDPASGAGPGELGSHERLGPHRGVQDLVVLPSGLVVSAGNDGRLLIWDPAVLAQPGRREEAKDVKFRAATLPDGRLVTGGSDGQVLLWDPADPGGHPATLGRHKKAKVKAVAALPDGRLVTGGSDGRLLLWDPSVPGGAPVRLGRHKDMATVAALPDGRVVTGGQETYIEDDLDNAYFHMVGRLLLWDPATPGARPVKLGSPGWINALTVLPDGRVATCVRDARLLLWDPGAPGAEPVKLDENKIAALNAVTALADGRLAAGRGDGQVLLWDPAARDDRPVRLGQHQGVTSVAELADGRLVTGGDEQVLVWDPARPGTGTVELNCSVRALAATPPGSAAPYLVIAHKKAGFSVWAVTTGPPSQPANPPLAGQD
jgi:WD40 repeat protein